MPNPENLTGHSFRDKPENINRKGRPPSLKGELRKLLNKQGKVTFKKKEVIKVHDNGDVDVKVPEREALMMKLIRIAMSTASNNVRAIQMVMEHLEGKPTQILEFMEYENKPTIFIDATEHLEDDEE